jgi:hypothetical protein
LGKAGVFLLTRSVIRSVYVLRMDWDFSIERNRESLLAVVAALFAMIGLAEGGMVERISRPLYRKVLGRVKAAEAPVRRLIIIAARNIKVEPRPKRPAPKTTIRSKNGKFQSKSSGQGGSGKSQSKSRLPSFPLCDPQKRSDADRPRRPRRKKYNGPEPRIRVLDYDPRIPWFLRGPDPTHAPAPVVPKVAPVKDYTVSAKRLCQRLFALVRALANIEREAKRYAQWLAQSIEDRRPRRERALRYGWPPGYRSKPTDEVHRILKECHWLISELPKPDTS